MDSQPRGRQKHTGKPVVVQTTDLRDFATGFVQRKKERREKGALLAMRKAKREAQEVRKERRAALMSKVHERLQTLENGGIVKDNEEEEDTVATEGDHDHNLDAGLEEGQKEQSENHFHFENSSTIVDVTIGNNNSEVIDDDDDDAEDTITTISNFPGTADHSSSKMPPRNVALERKQLKKYMAKLSNIKLHNKKKSQKTRDAAKAAKGKKKKRKGK